MVSCGDKVWDISKIIRVCGLDFKENVKYHLEVSVNKDVIFPIQSTS